MANVKLCTCIYCHPSQGNQYILKLNLDSGSNVNEFKEDDKYFFISNDKIYAGDYFQNQILLITSKENINFYSLCYDGERKDRCKDAMN